MGSLEEEQLLQMVHDFIEYGSSTSSSTSLSTKTHHSPTNYLTLHEILRNKTEEEKKIEEIVRKHMRKMEKTLLWDDGDLKQWLVQCLVLDGLHASLRHVSWVTTPSCPSGSYEYIEIVEEDTKGELVTTIVDIDLKSQFEVARPTQRYKDLLTQLPSIFVGKEAKLSSIITVLCSASEESLRDQGLHIPPWRRSAYMHSKWNISHYLTNNANHHHRNNNNNDNRTKTNKNIRYSNKCTFSGFNNGFSNIIPQLSSGGQG